MLFEDIFERAKHGNLKVSKDDLPKVLILLFLAAIILSIILSFALQSCAGELDKVVTSSWRQG